MGPTPNRDAPGHPTALAQPGLAHLPSGLQPGEPISQSSCSSLRPQDPCGRWAPRAWVTTRVMGVEVGAGREWRADRALSPTAGKHPGPQ